MPAIKLNQLTQLSADADPPIAILPDAPGATNMHL